MPMYCRQQCRAFQTQSETAAGPEHKSRIINLNRPQECATMVLEELHWLPSTIQKCWWPLKPSVVSDQSTNCPLQGGEAQDWGPNGGPQKIKLKLESGAKISNFSWTTQAFNPQKKKFKATILHSLIRDPYWTLWILFANKYAQINNKRQDKTGLLRFL